MNTNAKQTHRAKQVQSAWELWHKIEQLSLLLWDIYFDDFIDLAMKSEYKPPKND